MDAFARGTCCLVSPSVMQTMTADYYKEISGFMDGLLQEVYQNEIYGKPTEEIYNQINNFHYLYALMVMIWYEMWEDAQKQKYFGTGCETDQGVAFYVEKYNLACVKKKFFCTGRGYDVSSAMDVFGLNPDYQNQDGINYMHIQYSSSSCPENRNVFRVS